MSSMGMMSIEAGSEPIGNPSSARNCPSLLNGGIVMSSRVHHTFSDSVVPPPAPNTRDPGPKRIHIAWLLIQELEPARLDLDCAAAYL